MKFSRFNNPNKKKIRKKVRKNKELEEQLYALISKAKTQEERDLLVTAYKISINP